MIEARPDQVARDAVMVRAVLQARACISDSHRSPHFAGLYGWPPKGHGTGFAPACAQAFTAPRPAADEGFACGVDTVKRAFNNPNPSSAVTAEPGGRLHYAHAPVLLPLRGFWDQV